MFNKTNHKVENFSKELETKKKKKSNENSGTEKKKLTYSMRPLPQGWEQWLFMHRKQHRKENRECGI